jgi:hypothetical protein
MTPIQIDHILTFANVPNIDDYVEGYRQWGFLVTDETRPYQPGLRNRFLSLGTEYIEFVWVEDEAAFGAGETEEFARMFPDLLTFRDAARPFAIGFIHNDVHAMHQDWSERGYALPKVWSFTPPNVPPVLSFQVIPPTLLPGISGFALTYHLNPADPIRQVQIALNTVYALEGLTLVSDMPGHAAAAWRDLLVPNGTMQQEDDAYTVIVDPHTVQWMTPNVYTSRYGLNWTSAPHTSGAIGALHLLATDLNKVETMVGGNTHRIRVKECELLIIPPDAQDGLTFVVREYPIEQWLEERTAQTGEKIVVAG